MSTKQKKTSKREVILATLTLVSTLLTVMGTASALYFDWRNDEEARARASETLRESQEQDLRTHLDNAKRSLLACNLTPAEQAEIDSVLARATKELDVYGDTRAAQALLDSVHEKLVNCPIVTQTTVVTTTVPFVPYGYVPVGALLVMAVASLLLAVAWRSEHRRNKG